MNEKKVEKTSAKKIRNTGGSRLNIRKAQPTDVEEIRELILRVYPDMPPYPGSKLRGQINNFPEGHFVAELDGKIVGYCASILVPEEKATTPHNWREITGDGFGSTHTLTGNILYGYEICVDPEYRRLRIGQRFYNARKQLCRFLRLKGIVFAGRIPNLSKRIKKLGSVDAYIEAVKRKEIRDPVLSFQLKMGFEVLGVFPDYLPNDRESLGYGVHLIWKNPEYATYSSTQNKSSVNRSLYPSSTVRIAAIQYRQRKISSWDEFRTMVEYFVDVCSDYRTDFMLFPELFSLQLLSIENEPIKPHVAINRVARYEEDIRKMFHHLAVRFNINIIAGSHPVKREGHIYNSAMVFLRNGEEYEQFKIHATPNERYWWNIQGGNELKAIPTEFGPIGVLVCYDSEFPELARHLVDQGMTMLFVPFLTDERQSYCRVRYCAQARAVENQIFVSLAGSVGNLPNVQNIDIHYAQSGIFTPCDFPFARDGIAADTTPNVEMVAFADLNLAAIHESRAGGTVRNLLDRRHDLYTVKWKNLS